MKGEPAVDCGELARPFIHPSAIVDEGATIGVGSKIWHFCHISAGARIGADVVIGQGCFVADGVVVGNGCRIQNNVSVYAGVVLEERVFCGPAMVFTNVLTPRAGVSRHDEFSPTLVKRGATLGANCTIVCGNTIGEYATVAAGAVVTGDVPAHRLVAGIPARPQGWVCRCGEVLRFPTGDGAGAEASCQRCGAQYVIKQDGGLEPAGGA